MLFIADRMFFNVETSYEKIVPCKSSGNHRLLFQASGNPR
jgi:hypothetical protein